MQGARRFFLGLGAVLLLALLAAVYFRRPEAPPPAPPPAETAAPPAPAVSAVPSAPAKLLALDGRVVGSDLRPLPDLEVSLGVERASTGAEGAFELPASSRGPWSTLSVRRGSKDLAVFQPVWVGAEVQPAAGGEPAGAEACRPEGAPARLRFTVNLLGGEAGAGGGRAPPGPLLEARAVLVEDWGRGALVRIQGASTLPAGAHVDAALSFDGDRIVASTDRGEVRMSGPLPGGGTPPLDRL